MADALTTPGPWTAHGTIVRAEGRFICKVKHYPIPEDDLGNREERADARLIAAAPDLLEASKEMLERGGSAHASRMATDGAMRDLMRVGTNRSRTRELVPHLKGQRRELMGRVEKIDKLLGLLEKNPEFVKILDLTRELI